MRPFARSTSSHRPSTSSPIRGPLSSSVATIARRGRSRSSSAGAPAPRVSSSPAAQQGLDRGGGVELCPPRLALLHAAAPAAAGLRSIKLRSSAVSKIAESRISVILIVRGPSGRAVGFSPRPRWDAVPLLPLLRGLGKFMRLVAVHPIDVDLEGRRAEPRQQVAVEPPGIVRPRPLRPLVFVLGVPGGRERLRTYRRPIPALPAPARTPGTRPRGHPDGARSREPWSAWPDAAPGRLPSSASARVRNV